MVHVAHDDGHVAALLNKIGAGGANPRDLRGEIRFHVDSEARLPLQATTTPVQLSFLASNCVSSITVISVQAEMAWSLRNSMPFLRMRKAPAGRVRRVACA